MDIYKITFMTGPEGEGYTMYVQGDITYDKRKSIIKQFKYMVYSNIYSELMDALYYKDDMRNTVIHSVNGYVEEANILTEFETKFYNNERCSNNYYAINVRKISILEFN